MISCFNTTHNTVTLPAKNTVCKKGRTKAYREK